MDGSENLRCYRLLTRTFLKTALPLAAGSPSSSSASDADAASQAALSLGPQQREPLGHMLHVVHEHFKITACWSQAANLAAQAAKTLGADALSALNAVGENGGVGSLDSIVQAARIALDKFGA